MQQVAAPREAATPPEPHHLHLETGEVPHNSCSPQLMTADALALRQHTNISGDFLRALSPPGTRQGDPTSPLFYVAAFWIQTATQVLRNANAHGPFAGG